MKCDFCAQDDWSLLGHMALCYKLLCDRIHMLSISLKHYAIIASSTLPMCLSLKNNQRTLKKKHSCESKVIIMIRIYNFGLELLFEYDCNMIL